MTVDTESPPEKPRGKKTLLATGLLAVVVWFAGTYYDSKPYAFLKDADKQRPGEGPQGSDVYEFAGIPRDVYNFGVTELRGNGWDMVRPIQENGTAEMRRGEFEFAYFSSGLGLESYDKEHPGACQFGTKSIWEIGRRTGWAGMIAKLRSFKVRH